MIILPFYDFLLLTSYVFFQMKKRGFDITGSPGAERQSQRRSGHPNRGARGGRLAERRQNIGRQVVVAVVCLKWLGKTVKFKLVWRIFLVLFDAVCFFLF